MAGQTPLDLKKYEHRLRTRLRELDGRLGDIEHDLDEPADPDFEERATERKGDEVLEELGNAGLAELRMIQATLQRIEDRTFGVCVACGNPISKERLEILPHTPRCKHCA